MILYHTSDKVIECPDVTFSRLYLDFGKGFYTTPNKAQAVKYARRFFRENRPAFLNTYQVDEKQFVNYSKKIFDAYDGQWLDYVVVCRRNETHKEFDIIEGGIADDDVFNTLDLYMANLITKDEAIKRLKKKKPNWQICFCNQNLINSTFHFIESEELRDNEKKK